MYFTIICLSVFIVFCIVMAIVKATETSKPKQPTFNDEESKPIYDEMCNLLKNNTILTKEQDILLSAKVICVEDRQDRLILDGLLNVLQERTRKANNN